MAGTKSKADVALLEALNKATAETGKVPPAGKASATKEIQKEQERAQNAFNIRLSNVDATRIDTIVDQLRKHGRRSASSADAVRVALRALPVDAAEHPENYL